ncbi:unnamed protein product, partial [Amoebophrya sp. A25]
GGAAVDEAAFSRTEKPQIDPDRRTPESTTPKQVVKEALQVSYERACAWYKEETTMKQPADQQVDKDALKLSPVATDFENYLLVAEDIRCSDDYKNGEESVFKQLAGFIDEIHKRAVPSGAGPKTTTAAAAAAAREGP